MAWFDEAIFYHIYPLGLTGAPKQNSYEEPVSRLLTLIPWIGHIRELGCNAIYIGPLFESVGHGYETTDYRKLDSRLGTNEDLKTFVKECHAQGIRVIFDGVFNHTGRDFFAFQDIKRNRENSPYRDWYCNVNFWGNNEYNDGFSYDNWGGYNLLVKLNQRNPQVRDYICDVIRFWVSEFDVDGIRLDAADVLDFDFMKALRWTANTVKEDFWLMGEVIHGDYTRWVNEGTLHSVTNYHLHKALYSGCNDHNFFEIAHTVKRLYDMGGNRPEGLKLYNFVDNHDVERIYTKLNNKANFAPVHIMLYTLPGIPSLYYGSEFGIEGRKERYSDDSLRPCLNLADFENAKDTNPCTALISRLGLIRANVKALSYGNYTQQTLTTTLYSYTRECDGQVVAVTVNNETFDQNVTVKVGRDGTFIGALTGERVTASYGEIHVTVKANFGEIWIPESMDIKEVTPLAIQPSEKKSEPVSEAAAPAPKNEDAPAAEVPTKTAAAPLEAAPVAEAPAPMKKAETPAPTKEETPAPTPAKEETPAPAPEKAEEKKLDLNKPYEEMSIEELQACILAKMAKNGPITDRMRQDVIENVYPNSLLNWVRSFR